MPYQIADTSFGKVSYRRIGHGQRKVLFFHGFPGSSKQIDIFNSQLETHNLEVLCFDRPGYHHTRIKTANTLSLSIKIALELISELSWKEFELVAVSGGTPFAVSLALQNPHLVKNIRVVCGLGDLNLPAVRKNFSPLSFWGLKVLPVVPTALLKKALQINPGKRNPVVDFFLPPSKADMEIALDRLVRDSLNQSLSEAMEQNFLGPKQDTYAFLSNWSTGIANLNIPIHFWHGDQDNVISNKISASMAPLFPGGKMTLVKDHGHISLPVALIGQILSFEFAARS